MTAEFTEENLRQVGRSKECHLVIDDPSLSGVHARVEITPEGYVSIRDNDSRNGTRLHRSGKWVRIRRIILGAGDRVRFGDREVSVDQLLSLFGERTRVRLRHDERLHSREVFSHPRRNPVTGKIEEQVK